jgi:hypothetical protein
MAANYDQLSLEERDVFKTHLKAYMAQEDEIAECRSAQKSEIEQCADALDGWNKKEVRKYFRYIKKNTSAQELREDAEFLEEFTGMAAVSDEE